MSGLTPDISKFANKDNLIAHENLTFGKWLNNIWTAVRTCFNGMVTVSYTHLTLPTICSV